MNFELPELTFDYDALAPHIDTKTMEIHHSKHHGGYVNKLNKCLEGNSKLSEKSIEALISNIRSIPEEIQTAVRNNGGGHFNHTLFWTILSPNGGGQPKSEISELLDKQFGSLKNFKEEFSNAATNRFGSGWAWLCYRDKQLFVCSTQNQDNPMMDILETRGVPILGLDVWEHAYYLHYQNKRASYIDAFWNVVDWDSVNDLYNAAPVVEEIINQKSLI